MIKERYVSSEVAKLLKDKGFDEECNAIYDGDGYFSVNDGYINGQEPDEFFSALAPTQQMACDWIEERYQIHIVVRFRSKRGYVGSIYDISNPDNTLYMLNTRAYSSIEQVYNEALKYVLTNLI